MFLLNGQVGQWVSSILWTEKCASKMMMAEHVYPKVVLRRLSAGMLLLAMAGCQSLPKQEHSNHAGTIEPVQQALRSTIAASSIHSEAQRLAAEGIDALDSGRLVEASERFNQALKLDVDASYLHLLNGYAYHQRALLAEGELYEMAIEGYRRAITFDHSNWFAHFYLGQLYIEQRAFGRAQQQFERAAIYQPEDPDVLYGLALSAYYAHDLRTAAVGLAQLRDHDGLSESLQRAVLHSSAIVAAALGEHQEAQQWIEAYAANTSVDNSGQLQRRVDSWSRVNQLVEKRSEQPLQTSAAASDGVAEAETGTDEGAFIEDEMAVVDVTIIRTEEDISTSKGVNLLSGLQFQFGNMADGVPGFALGTTDVRELQNSDGTLSTTDTNTRTLTRQITFPGVNYSLNIANAHSDRNEVLARPTLVARAGQQSEFFSGVEVAAAATSGGAGDSISIEKEVGVKLSVTPEFLPNNKILLQIEAERTFLTQPSSSVQFEFRLDTSKTTVNANVAMGFGQTLILSGLSERETERNRDEVPILGELPVVQYLFSKANSREFRKSVLILLTPRRTQYLHSSERQRQQQLAKLSPEERRQSLFEQRYSDWFAPLPHTAHIFNHFQDNALYRDEFRTGDFPLIRWNSLQSHTERLKKATEYLYY